MQAIFAQSLSYGGVMNTDLTGLELETTTGLEPEMTWRTTRHPATWMILPQGDVREWL